VDSADVGKLETLNKAVEKVSEVVGDNGLSLLINNAGIFSNDGQSLEDISLKTIQEFMEVNLFGAIFVTKVKII